MALMLASAPRRAKRVDGGAPSVEGLGHGRLAQLAERWPHMLRPEIGPLGKSLTCRGVFLSAFGWRGAVWGGFEPVAGITAGITERSSSDRFVRAGRARSGRCDRVRRGAAEGDGDVARKRP